jgi:hypothetical protein
MSMERQTLIVMEIVHLPRPMMHLQVQAPAPANVPWMIHGMISMGHISTARTMR